MKNNSFIFNKRKNGNRERERKEKIEEKGLID